MVVRQAIGSFFFLAFIVLQQGADQVKSQQPDGFVQTNGTRFIVDGDIVYFNGFNAYWMMLESSFPSERGKVSSALEQASSYGLTLARTWAFSDGGPWPLQLSPGSYNESMFKALDFVISEARRNKIYLILSLVNNYESFGGRKQYVQWGRERGQNVSSDDGFYTNDVIKGYYKNHVKTVLTRINTVTGLAYKDDPTIFAWELINEPRCESDLSGRTFQAWIEEMAAYVKSIDNKHLLEIGMEGFYGDSMQGRRQFNPNGYVFGTDFISHNQVQGIDFATIHAYPDLWLANWSSGDQLRFLQNWTQIHVSDSSTILKKPLLFTEFGKSLKPPGSTVNQRDAFYGQVYGSAFVSAEDEGPLGGGLFWQLLAQGMDGLRDSYEIVPTEQRSTASIISQISRRISGLNNRRRHG
ncbi:mannan endo-1,4-beta-mannosidase 1 [Elaeis guineensis]